MTLSELIKNKPKELRLGQHFINMCIKDDTDPIFHKNGSLYNVSDDLRALRAIMFVIETYNWDENDLPTIPRNPW